MYKRNDWIDHVVQRPKTYTETTNPDGSKTFVDAPGEIIQQGTPMSATNFNNMEDGIGDAHVSLDVLIAYVMMKLARSNHTLDSLDTAKLDLLGTAEAAKKLAPGKAIGITGKATGAGVLFDGTGAVNINVTDLDAMPASEALALVVATDVLASVRQAEARTQERRITTIEAQFAAMT